MPTAPFETAFAENIYNARYKHPQDGNWAGTARRVAGSVMPALYHAPKARGKHQLIESTTERVCGLIERRQFMPGGRYLYAAGRDLHQVNNCVLLRADDSREGWASLSYKAEMSLMTGAGIGVWYGDLRGAGEKIARTGGEASGPLGKMMMVNDMGRYVMQGGARRCLPGASMVTMADFSTKRIDQIIAGDVVATRFGPRAVVATECAGSKPIIQIDTEYGSVRCSEDHKWLAADTTRTKSWKRAKSFTLQHKLYRHPVPSVISTDVADLELAYTQGYFAGDGCAYSSNRTHEVTFQMADKWWRPKQNDIITRTMSKWGNVRARPGHGHCTELRCRGKAAVAEFQKIKAPHAVITVPEYVLKGSIETRSAFLAGWWDADGSYTPDRWALSNHKDESRTTIQNLLTSLGIESSVSGLDVRVSSYQRPLFDATVGMFTHKKPSGHFSRKEAAIPTDVTGVIRLPEEKVYDIQVDGEEFIADGFVSHNSAIWAGLPWWHPDVFAFIECKDWPEWLRLRKDKDWTIPAPMDTTNISVSLDAAFFTAYHSASSELSASVAPDGGSWHDWAVRVYDTALCHMLRHGEPGFTVDVGDKHGEVLRNACTEITSADDGDVCNLGSLVMSRFESPVEFGKAVRDACAFLTAGTMYSHVPYTTADVPRGNIGIDEVRDKNRRLGLGLIGVHELLMMNGVYYGTADAFEVLLPWCEEYGRALEYSHEFQNDLALSLSAGATAIAPNGTIGAVAESTASADPMLSAAKIQVVKSANVHGSDTHIKHVVVDPVAARLRASGVPSALIEDAYTLSYEPERRLAQQAFLQGYVDHAISSTVNLPEAITRPAKVREFGDVMMRYLPELRGVTCYPNGARAGQPQTPVDLDWALANVGTVFEADENTCAGGVCGI